MTARVLAPDIAGLKILLPDPCDGCAAHSLAVLGADTELHCVDCGTARGRVGPKTKRFLEGILRHFGTLGRPTEITLRRPVGEIQSIDLIRQPPEEDAGALMDADLARRRRWARGYGGG